MVKAQKEEAEAAKQQEQSEWKKDKEGIDKLRNLAGG